MAKLLSPQLHIIHTAAYLHLPLSPVVPPNILDIESTPSSVAVRENQNINMTCRADGFPTPKIIWRREDGEEIAVEKKKKGIREGRDAAAACVGGFKSCRRVELYLNYFIYKVGEETKRSPFRKE